MNSSSFINTNSLYSQGDFLPARDPPKKGLVPHLSGRWNERQIPTSSISRVGRYTDLAGCVLVPLAVRLAGIHIGRAETSILEPQGPSLQALTLFGGARFIAWLPNFGECRRGPRHFGAAVRVWVTTLCTNPSKKSLCKRFLVGGTYDNYRLHPSCQTWQFSDGHPPPTSSTITPVPSSFSSSLSSFWSLTGGGKTVKYCKTFHLSSFVVFSYFQWNLSFFNGKSEYWLLSFIIPFKGRTVKLIVS